MWFDLVSYPGWLATALAIGLVVGWRTYSDAPRGGLLDGWFKWGALLFVLGVVVAVFKLVPGRYGLWLEIALLMTALYVVGCFLGGWLKDLLGAHETGAARAAADRLAAEAAAKAQAARRNAAVAKAEAGRLGVSAKVEPERKVAKAEMERQARRLPRRARLLPLPRRRRIALQRKLRLHEKWLRVPKPRRIVRLQRLPRRPRLSEKLSPRPRRIVWLQRLPRGPKSNERLILIASPRRLQRPMEGRTI